MKKIFIFIFLLFSIIFFSSCHDEGLSGIIDKSELPPPEINGQTIVFSGAEKHTEFRLEKLTDKNSLVQKNIQNFV
ncbi:hypothetical protein [Blattabacterium cuenoti]|uniref:hypothetical protein n=1 Tax=Blattabacterium cuenoti TaxID=1653831 RepID=UPI00311ED52C